MMLRIALTSCFIVVLGTHLAMGQQPDDFAPQPAPLSTTPVTDDAQISAAEADAVDEAVAEAESPAWQPAMRVFLNEKPGAETQFEDQVVKVPVTETAYTLGRAGGKVRNVPKQVTRYVDRVVKAATTKFFMMDCDDIDIQVSLNEEGGKSFNFEVKGKLRFQNGATVIRAESGILEENKLTLKSAEIDVSGVKMQSGEVVIDLPVTVLRIGEVNEQPAGELTPIPASGPVYEGSSDVTSPAATFNDNFTPVPTASGSLPFPAIQPPSESDFNPRPNAPRERKVNVKGFIPQ